MAVVYICVPTTVETDSAAAKRRTAGSVEILEVYSASNIPECQDYLLG